MGKYKKNNRKKKEGLPPGSLIYIGKEPVQEVTVDVFEYNDQFVEERRLDEVLDVGKYLDKETVTWININGVHNVNMVDSIGRQFGLHPLTIEDILNTEHRPKIDFFEDHLIVIVKMLDLQKTDFLVGVEQVSFLLFENVVLTFQERVGDLFEPIRTQLRENIGRIRKQGADYLLYSLMDTIFDQYLIVADDMDDRLDAMEEIIITDPPDDALQEINSYKNSIGALKKMVWPAREVINKLLNRDVPLIKSSTYLYFRDIQDHVIHTNDMIDTMRSKLYGMLEVYYSSLSNKMNEIMKLLTMVSTVFIPLTFIAGVYGMNFTYMPELNERTAYPIVWIVMVAISIVMLIYFKKKKWF
ncbi:magnesium/cobalt transporter CorA [Pseudalkalibacillus caeni]|uniref:Magnesium transport protein CorA n=1 Tax=Exobacillus caeni TaxID=2574798 RepID=A0A5R9F3Z0_9BACL|nr:magnesium/cobalt transporter CorA [Pseudalkalibacillus caeni]TLS37721.1 magnesium/cobalt transporter CorA [Pseudalkalibacillus caeni]